MRAVELLEDLRSSLLAPLVLLQHKVRIRRSGW
jgi:hypothetical protein